MRPPPHLRCHLSPEIHFDDTVTLRLRAPSAQKVDPVLEGTVTPMQQDADGLRTALHRLGSGILPLEAVAAGCNQQDLPVLIIAAGLRENTTSSTAAGSSFHRSPYDDGVSPSTVLMPATRILHANRETAYRLQQLQLLDQSAYVLFPQYNENVRGIRVPRVN